MKLFEPGEMRALVFMIVTSVAAAVFVAYHELAGAVIFGVWSAYWAGVAAIRGNK